MTAPTPSCPTTRETVSGVPIRKGSFWTRYKTLINFWLDGILLLLFLVQAWLVTVLTVVLPRGPARASIWGATSEIWLDRLFVTCCTFAIGILLHVMLHWNWICGTVSTRLLGRKAHTDDGSQTLIGVGLLIGLLHVFAVSILAAQAALQMPL